eukprot:5881969-Amphidinium_carterae.2
MFVAHLFVICDALEDNSLTVVWHNAKVRSGIIIISDSRYFGTDSRSGVGNTHGDSRTGFVNPRTSPQ